MHHHFDSQRSISPRVTRKLFECSERLSASSILFVLCANGGCLAGFLTQMKFSRRIGLAILFVQLGEKVTSSYEVMLMSDSFSDTVWLILHHPESLSRLRTSRDLTPNRHTVSSKSLYYGRNRGFPTTGVFGMFFALNKMGQEDGVLTKALELIRSSIIHWNDFHNPSEFDHRCNNQRIHRRSD